MGGGQGVADYLIMLPCLFLSLTDLPLPVPLNRQSPTATAPTFSHCLARIIIASPCHGSTATITLPQPPTTTTNQHCHYHFHHTLRNTSTFNQLHLYTTSIPRPHHHHSVPPLSKSKSSSPSYTMTSFPYLTHPGVRRRPSGEGVGEMKVKEVKGKVNRLGK